MHYFYMLFSHKDGRYYYGSTSNLKRRFAEHNAGKVDSTSYRRPLELVYYEAYLSVDAARKREGQVKASSAIRKSLHQRVHVDAPSQTRHLGNSVGQPG